MGLLEPPCTAQDTDVASVFGHRVPWSKGRVLWSLGHRELGRGLPFLRSAELNRQMGVTTSPFR